MSKAQPLTARIAQARLPGSPAEVRDRAVRLLQALVKAAAGQGRSGAEVAAEMASGATATQLGQVELATQPAPPGLACAQGCAFCCILPGADGGTMTEFEARRLHAALAPLAGAPDGTAWHPEACPAFDPETRACRAYEARPMICRSYVSTDVSACEKIAAGTPASGSGALGAYGTYLAAHGLARAALKGRSRVPTFALKRLAAAALAGQDVETALKAAQHAPASLDAERKRHAAGLARH